MKVPCLHQKSQTKRIPQEWRRIVAEEIAKVTKESKAPLTFGDRFEYQARVVASSPARDQRDVS